ncbi:MAG: sigma factor [Beijerinckiaceae bacterium]|nr:sigma factor [Beijerinckiaceae bacterium]MCZ8300282.1 sigma factor [Beijerinckiaceae bacterium]
MDLARDTAERVARESYGRLVALLAARSRDIAGAEDALADALVAALRTWPERGVPASPDAWLLTAARNRMRNAYRHRTVTAAAEPDLLLLHLPDDSEPQAIPDERLKLLFVCAHPAIEAGIRTPLMLQTILGLDAARIGSAFLVSPAAMAQRLVRAKAKIKEAGLRFEVPFPAELPERIAEILDAIYAAYGVGWDGHHGGDAGIRDLAQEAIYLGRLLVSLLPDEPEAKGLLALMLYCEARRAARSDAEGRFIPLERQDARLWSRDLIAEAEALLIAASRFGTFGRFQCEAAIQSVHVQRPLSGRTDYSALVTLYRLLAERHPSVGALLGYAAVLVEAGRAAEARAVLESFPAEEVRTHQPYWVTLARMQDALGQRDAAAASLRTAIGLTESEAVRAFLRTLL